MYLCSLDSKYRLKRIRLIADYQFGFGSGLSLFDDDCKFILSKTFRIKQILSSNNERIATLRPSDGFLILSIYGSKKIHKFLSYPKLRVVVLDDAVPYVSIGKTAFNKHIIFVDKNLRCLDEVLIVDKNDTLLGVGQLLLAPNEILNSDSGPGVFVRSGINKI